MVETLKSQEKNKIKKLEKIAETRMAVYIYIYIVCCHLENKKEKLNSNKNKGRTMPNRKNGIGLSFCAFCEKNSHKHKRAGP